MQESKEDAALREMLISDIMESVYTIADNINEFKNDVEKL